MGVGGLPLGCPLIGCLSPRAYLDRANKQLTPLAQELRSNVLGLFSSLLELGKGEGQP